MSALGDVNGHFLASARQSKVANVLQWLPELGNDLTGRVDKDISLSWG